MVKLDDLVKAIKKINITVNQLKDYVVMLAGELDKKKIINKKTFDNKFYKKVNEIYGIDGVVEYKFYNMEED